MRVKYSPLFLTILKKLDVRIYKSLKQRISIFIYNSNDSQLNNHALRDEYLGCRSIDITADWRAVYQEIDEEMEIVAYFVTLGTHNQLFGKHKNSADS